VNTIRFMIPVLAVSTALAQPGPLVTSWLTSPTGRYARLFDSDASRNAGSALTTWSRGQGVQSSPAYAGVMQVSYSANWVYLRSTGLGYHTMGPWYLDGARLQAFPNFPANQNVLYRLPRSPVVASSRTLTPAGPIGYFVDGVAVFDNRDTFSYTNATGADAQPGGAMPGPGGGGQGDGIWNRDAWVNEGVTFDSANAHQAGANYHYHANTPALRAMLGDNVEYSATTKSYVEKSTPPTAHSPILGWMADGYPVYGPYGYSSPMDPTSTVRRMISGYVKRDGSSGTANLVATGRTTLPAWAARAQGRSANLASTQYGPAVAGIYALGRYLEDYDYRGELGYTLGTDFDLDLDNGRFCVTPEFPGGTYAYFLSIEANGTPRFPYTIGRWFHGSPTGGAVTSIAETVTEYSRSGPARGIQVSASSSPAAVNLTWTSVEGGTYVIATSADGTNFTSLASGVTSAGTSTSFLTAVRAAYYQVTLTALAVYDSRGTGGVSGVGERGVAPGPADASTAPVISTAPSPVTIVSGDRAQLKVTATGSGTLSYQWYRGASGNATNPIAGATSTTLTTPALVESTGFWVRVTDTANASTNSPAATVTVSASAPIVVQQSLLGAGYTGGGAVTVMNTISYSGAAPSALAWSVLLPAGAVYLSSGGAEGTVKPAAEATGLLEWKWTSVPAGSCSFTYTILFPATASGDQTIAALVTATLSGTDYQMLAKPDPLLIRSASPHSADTNRDFQISLMELTRVIELYNYRSGSIRTGQYRLKAGSEDGFEPGPSL
jgi:YHYH protein